MKLSYSIFFVLGFLSQSECILHGREVTHQNIRKFGYQVSIYIHDAETDAKHTCGGGILDDRIIITAAHCFANWRGHDIGDFDSIRVTAHTLTSRESISQGSIEREVKRIYVPKEFFKKIVDGREVGGFADIAILKLRRSLNLRSRNFFSLKKLTLPEANYVTLGKEAVVAGYGTYQLRDDADQQSEDVLRYMKVVVVPKPAYDHDPHTEERFVHAKPADGEIAGGMCNGDSGSPLVVKTKKHAGLGRDYTVAGISLGNSDDCNDTIKPGTYVRVSTYLNFIHEVLHNPASTAFVVKHVRRSTTTSCFG